MTEAAIPIDQIDPVPAPETKRRRKVNGTAVAVASEAQMPAHAPAPSLLALLHGVMSDPSTSIERLNSAFDFYQRMEAAAARKAFEAAMADAKAEFEPIVKRRLVDYVNKDGKRTTYKHEDLADVSAAVDPVLAKHGLSTRYRTTSNPNEPITCTCIVAHRDGHFEETTLAAGADTSGGKNSIQSIASTLTYLQRMTKKAALGLAAGRDDDGNGADQKLGEFITDAQCQAILDKIAETQSDTERFCAFFKIDGVAKLPAAKFNHAMGLLNQKRKA